MYCRRGTTFFEKIKIFLDAVEEKLVKAIILGKMHRSKRIQRQAPPLEDRWTRVVDENPVTKTVFQNNRIQTVVVDMTRMPWIEADLLRRRILKVVQEWEPTADVMFDERDFMGELKF